MAIRKLAPQPQKGYIRGPATYVVSEMSCEPIEANKNQSVDRAEGLFLRSGSPQNVYLLPQHPNFSIERCPRPRPSKIMSLTRFLIPQEHRPILNQLLVRLSLR
jgi:hypothetical protein